jgi:hypothetical protein
MEKKVIVIAKKDCHFCEVLLYEMIEINKLKPYTIMDNVAPELFSDFVKHFAVNRFPAIQIDNGVEFITIHMDKNQTIDNPNYIYVNNIGEMLDKVLELISE